MAVSRGCRADNRIHSDGCGRGFYYNGYRCAPMRDYGPPPGYYGPPPGYYGPPRDEGPVFRFNFGGGDNRHYARPVRNQRGQLVCQQRNYTIQYGFCKPYRGY